MPYTLPTGLGGPHPSEHPQPLAYKTAAYLAASAAQTNPLLVTGNVVASVGDGANLDAFSRLRTSNPQGIFDGQMTYNLLPLQFEVVTSGAGAAVTHDTVNRCALHTFADTPNGGVALMQSYEYIRYQPGRSQAAFVTFNFIESKAGVTKFAGLSDGNNGYEFRQAGSVAQWCLLSDSSNGDQIVAQADWNIDKLDGNGVSGFTLDLTKTQIAVIDFQALYVGRVRVGFDIDGMIVYVHEFLHANRIAFPYIQTASLPIRCGMTCTDTASTTMRFICSAVLSEGGQEENGGVPSTATGTVTAADGVDTHILSVRPTLTFGGLSNRVKLVVDSVEIYVSGNTGVLWKLVIGQAISGTTAFNAVNATYSAFEFNTAGTASGSPSLVLMSGFVPATAQSKGTSNPRTVMKTPITLDRAGAHRLNGTISVLVQGLGAISACRCALNWRELR